MSGLAYAKAGVFPEGYRQMAEVEAAQDPHLDTRDEPWCLDVPEQGHVYRAACEFVLKGLGVGEGRRCLVAGSPLFEVTALNKAGWYTAFVDVREPPAEFGRSRYYCLDASDLSYFRDGEFDAVSSTCCLCHVGLGRYGDPIVEDGDRKALKEFHRVLRPGGRAAVCFGPCLLLSAKNWLVGRVHRIYSLDEARAMTEEAGLVIKEEAIWCSNERRWLGYKDRWNRLRTETKAAADADSRGELFYFHYCYFMTLLEKPA